MDPTNAVHTQLLELLGSPMDPEISRQHILRNGLHSPACINSTVLPSKGE